MEKANVFRSSKFYMWAGDVLHLTLLDESGVPVTVNLVSVTTPEVPDAGTPLPPVATSATSVVSNVFSANWNVSTLATKYYLDVATDLAFTSMVGGYSNKDVGNVLTYSITGLPLATDTYYYRVRAYNTIGTSDNSNTVSADIVVYDDWFLPSHDGLQAIYTELYLHGVGGLSAVPYWSSTENNLASANALYFNSGIWTLNNGKNSPINVRACRSFTSTTAYVLRGIGQAGGRVFYKSGNNYMELALVDQSAGQAWSNVTGTLIGTTSALIGEGLNNTNEIIGQVGHTGSAAKLCNDLVM